MLLRLVPEDPLAHQRTGPSAEKYHPVKGLLRDPPAIGLGAAFVEPVRREGDQAHDADDAQVSQSDGCHAATP